MKIAMVSHLISRNNGGIMSVMAPLSREFQRKKHDVCVFGLSDSYSNEDSREYSCPVRCFQPQGPLSWGFSAKMAEGIREFEPDIIHIHGIWTFHVTAGRLAASNGIPWFISPHGMLDPWALANSGRKKKIFRFLVENRNFRSVSAFHALCWPEEEQIRACGFTSPVVRIPNGIDIPDCPGKDGKDGDRILLYLGRLHPKKGLSNLIRSFCRLNNKQWTLRIIGWDQNGYRAELENILASPENRNARVEILGPLFGQAKEQEYLHASAFVLPSFSEGLPMTILEAWAWRLPVLMTEQCNLPVGFKCRAAVRIPAERDFTLELEQFFSLDESERIEMGERGRELAERFYSWETIAEEYLRFYKDSVK